MYPWTTSPLLVSLTSNSVYHHPKTVINFLYSFNKNPDDPPFFTLLHNITTLFDEFNQFPLLENFDDYPPSVIRCLYVIAITLLYLHKVLDMARHRDEFVTSCQSLLDMTKLLKIKNYVDVNHV